MHSVSTAPSTTALWPPLSPCSGSGCQGQTGGRFAAVGIFDKAGGKGQIAFPGSGTQASREGKEAIGRR